MFGGLDWTRLLQLKSYLLFWGLNALWDWLGLLFKSDTNPVNEGFINPSRTMGFEASASAFCFLRRASPSSHCPFFFFSFSHVTSRPLCAIFKVDLFHQCIYGAAIICFDCFFSHLFSTIISHLSSQISP